MKLNHLMLVFPPKLGIYHSVTWNVSIKEFKGGLMAKAGISLKFSELSSKPSPSQNDLEHW